MAAVLSTIAVHWLLYIQKAGTYNAVGDFGPPIAMIGGL
jgi:hypothetical protein